MTVKSWIWRFEISWRPIPQTAGLVGIAEGNRYVYGLAMLQSILPVQQIAAVHDTFRLELIDKDSWDFAAGIPQWLIASAGGSVRVPRAATVPRRSPNGCGTRPMPPVKVKVPGAGLRG